MEGYKMVSHDSVGSDDTFSLLLDTLKSESLLCASTVDLMNKILSRENYVNVAAQLDLMSDAENLLNLIGHWLQKYSLSNQDPATVDMSRRARRFMQAVISTMHDVPLSNIPHDPDSYMFPLLLTILSNEPEFPVTSVDNKTTMILVSEILSREDYITLASQVNQFSDAMNLLELITHMLCHYSLPNCDSVTIGMNRRARQLMLAVISKMCGETQSNVPYDLHMLPSLFYILNHVELGYPLATNELAVNLMSKTDHDIYSDAGLCYGVEAWDLLDFIWHRIYASSYWNSDDVGLQGRANQFILEVNAKTRGISLSNSNTPCNPYSKAFQLIIAILNFESRKPTSIVFDDDDILYPTLNNLICEILSQEDCIDIVAQLDHTTDATNLLDFVLYYFWMEFDQDSERERLFLLKIMSKTYIEPPPNPDDPENYSFPLLLYILNCRVSGDYDVHPVAINLMCHILSRDEYISPVAKLDKVSDAKNLLHVLLKMLEYDIPFSNQDSSTVDMNRRGRQFMLEVFSKMHIVPSLNMPYGPDSYALPLLLYILNDSDMKNLYPTALGATIVNLLCDILSREDYVDLVIRIDDPSDASQLLDSILDILLNHHVSTCQDSTVDITRRARRFMFKVISKMPVIPPSLIVTGVAIPSKRNYIGSGGFGRVFRGELRGEVVALKVLYKSDNQVAFCREALMWRSLDHKFVLPFLGIHEIERPTSVPQFFLVSPYMKNGTLARWRKQANPPIAIIEERVLEVAQAMEYIHSEGVVHGDLRGENVLLDDHFHVQIADFGLTRLSEATNTRSGALHLNFAAPELFGQLEDDNNPSDDTCSRTEMSDVYAFGCLYYEIHYNNIPFAGKPDLQILSLVSRGARPPRLDEQPLSDGAWDLIQRCWVKEPSKRPKMNKAVESMIAMSQSVSPQINTDYESMREELPSSAASDSTASQKRKREPDNHVASTSGITSSPDGKRRRHDSESE